MVTHRKGPPTRVLADEYLAGSTTVELAQRHGMSPAAINGRLKRAGVAIRPAQRRSPADNASFRADAIAMYKKGFTIADVAAKLGGERGRSTIQRVLASEGVWFRRHGTRSPTIRLPVDPFEIGYLAGIFDGEGNLQMRGKKCRNGSETTGCKISIYSTTASVMGWLISKIGGKARWDYKRQERKGWLPCGSWEISRAQDIILLLELMLPYLLVKKKLAVKVLKYLREKCGHDSPPAITQ